MLDIRRSAEPEAVEALLRGPELFHLDMYFVG
ncbi:MAG: hypothetical protein CM1200mP14_24260 [Gammaproteobacteria bacterium]|nr:MAG: hypothetical protein CM1200mP14_24260 [Gammaproteobacteria bacterium]